MRYGFVGLVLMSVAVASSSLSAQQTGATITGRIVDRASQRPLEAAQVRVTGTQRRTASDAAGAYRIAGVSPGEVQIVAQRIGYAPVTRTVSVPASGTVTVDFSLVTSATQLDQVVVTATGETQRKRETGNVIASIDTSTLTLAATTNFSSVLAARAPGVSVISSGGTAGTNARVRIRGSNSISLSNDPLLIIDGIRVDNNSNSSSIGVGGQLPSRFNDINPDEIENIEIIKGPAAAALYGTAASNGVIQITTKKGRAGKTRWDASFEGGSSSDINVYPSNYLAFGKTTAGVFTRNCNIDLQARRQCTVDSVVTNNPIANSNPFRDGNRKLMGLSAAGGGDAATYFLSGEYNREQGVYDINQSQQLFLRTNVRAQLKKTLDAAISVGYVNSDLRLPQNDNNLLGVISAALLGNAFDCSTKKSYPTLCGSDTTSRGYTSGQIPSEIMAIDTRQQVQKFTGGVTSNFQPLSWLNFTGTLGADVVNRFDSETVPPEQIFLSTSTREGSRQANRAVISNYTTNINGTATYDFNSALRFTSSIGSQYSKELFRRTDAFGAKLLGGTNSLAGTNARFSVNEVNTDVRTIGYYGREQVAWRDKLFLTGALRTDRNSAFGKNFDNILYPSIGASWVLGEESFFPKALSAISLLRLRSAYGVSGQKPGFRAADFFYNPVAVNVAGVDVPGFTIGGPGNAALRPERSSEVEGGLDLGLFKDRLSFEYTAYDKRTTDALVQAILAPSLGLGNSRFLNLGQVRNRGQEIGVRAAILAFDNLQLDLTSNFSFTANRLDNLGTDPQGNPIPPIFQGFSSTQVIRNFLPLGAYMQRPITSYGDLNGDGVVSRVNCPGQPALVGGPACEITIGDTAVFLGTPFATREFNFTPALTLFKNVRVSALIDYRGGQQLYNNTRSFRCSNGGFQNCADAADPKLSTAKDQAAILAALMGTQAGFIEDASFTKLREVALTINAPRALADRVRAGAASLTFAGRNLKTWTKYSGFDPEVNAIANGNFTSADFLTQPNLRYYTARLNLTF
ncbi:MAG: TonB-dependent outer membrane protein SusC/RagA [Gemmatimonadetes bacterium]|nr:TonB-dependent outer membrane protein SusC/RagA [Gemmatimonadota bacterium]